MTERIINLYKKHQDVELIAERLGLSQKYVKEVLVKVGFRLKRITREWNIKEIDEIVLNGLSASQTAKLYNVTRNSIIGVRHRHGVLSNRLRTENSRKKTRVKDGE